MCKYSTRCYIKELPKSKVGIISQVYLSSILLVTSACLHLHTGKSVYNYQLIHHNVTITIVNCTITITIVDDNIELLYYHPALVHTMYYVCTIPIFVNLQLCIRIVNFLPHLLK